MSIANSAVSYKVGEMCAYKKVKGYFTLRYSRAGRDVRKACKKATSIPCPQDNVHCVIA
jgi:hypothetical protein